MSKIFHSLIFRLIAGLIVGIIVGLIANESLISVLHVINRILYGLIQYTIPLIILGFITPAIVNLRENVGKILGVTLLICYLSSIGAAFFSFISGRVLIPFLNIPANAGGLRKIPDPIFQLEIQPLLPVMTALITAIIFGLAVLFTGSTTFENLLNELNRIVLWIVNRIVIKILPFYIALNFAELAYEGGIIKQLPVFFKVILIVLIGHFIWMTVLYLIGGALSKTNPKEVFRHYGPAYLTALGSMSSAVTLPVALRCASKSKTLDPKIRDFVIPICSNTHLCGSVLTEVFFVMTVSQVLYGHLPEPGKMILFVLLLGIFAIAAPGVPGGTVVASLGLITSILGFNEQATALMLSIFALQDSFGTACNITGDGAIALMVTGLFTKKKKTAA